MQTKRHHHPHRDLAHHHPAVHKVQGKWVWACTCGGASCRTSTAGLSWRHAVIEALLHSTSIAA
ncbi:MAG TPA: hypothetical protein VFJ22_21085 [Dermatophilaceae bacterium]|nr:hypothetical protein [Dermatophilaceae bacterium]